MFHKLSSEHIEFVVFLGSLVCLNEFLINLCKSVFHIVLILGDFLKLLRCSLILELEGPGRRREVLIDLSELFLELTSDEGCKLVNAITGFSLLVLQIPYVLLQAKIGRLEIAE